MTEKLAELQQEFSDYILDGNETFFDSVQKAPGQEQSFLSVYGDGYYYRLIEVLGLDFLRLQQYLGDEAFFEMAKAYITRYPSQSPSVRYVGQNLPTFLQSPPYSDNPILAEIALFDWMFEGRLDASDGPVLTIADLKAIPPESWSEMCIVPHPSLARADFYHNTRLIWEALDRGEAVPPARCKSEPAVCYFWRYELTPYYCQLNVQDTAMMEALQAGHSFGQVCELLGEYLSVAEVAPYAVGKLQQWISDGLLSRVQTSSIKAS